MKVIISGVNRMEFCDIKRKDLDKRFFMTRGELYFVPTNGMTRLRRYEYGKEKESDEVIIYEENMITPYDTRDIQYSMDNLLSDIDRYKMMTDYSWFKRVKPWFETTGIQIWKLLTSTGGIVVIVLAWVFLTGGFK